MELNAIQAETLGEALKRHRRTFRSQPKTIKAINKAALELIGAGEWTFDTADNRLTITSATRQGVRYVVDFLWCTCPAATHGRMCWHSHARDLLETAVYLEHEQTMPAAEVQAIDDAAYESLLAEVDAWF